MSQRSRRKREFTSRFRSRYREDFQFAIIILFGILSLLVVAAFAVYRWVLGNGFGGLINLGIVLGLLSALIYAIRTPHTSRAGMVFIFVIIAGCLVSTAAMGRTGIFWTYVVLWINFLLTSRRIALSANLILIAGLVIGGNLFDTILETITYVVTTLMITIFSYISARRLAYQQKQLQKLVLQDPLTKAGNRRMMMQDLRIAKARNRRTGRPYTLMLIDLDHFKQINDQQGHDVGDQALRKFAKLVRGSIREDDGFYRFGGEEFVLLLSDCGVKSKPSYAANQRMRTSDVKNPAHHDSRADKDITEVAQQLHQRMSGQLNLNGWILRFSAGVAELRPDEDWSECMRRADRALYQAKQAGRDRVIVWNDSMLSTRGQVALKSV